MKPSECPHLKQRVVSCSERPPVKQTAAFFCSNREGGFTFVETLITIALAGIVTGALLLSIYQLSRGSGNVITQLKDTRRLSVVDATFRRTVRNIRPPYWAIDTIVDESESAVSCRYYLPARTADPTAVMKAETILNIGVSRRSGVSILSLAVDDTSQYVRMPDGEHTIRVIRDHDGTARGLELLLSLGEDTVRISELFGGQPVVIVEVSDG